MKNQVIDAGPLPGMTRRKNIKSLIMVIFIIAIEKNIYKTLLHRWRIRFRETCEKTENNIALSASLKFKPTLSPTFAFLMKTSDQILVKRLNSSVCLILKRYSPSKKKPALLSCLKSWNNFKNH